MIEKLILERNGRVRQFLSHYARALLVPTALAGSIVVAGLLTVFLFWPIFAGVWIELGLPPWAFATSSEPVYFDDLPMMYYAVESIWLVFGITGIYAAAKTWSDVL